jgi:hypothetical protein
LSKACRRFVAVCKAFTTSPEPEKQVAPSERNQMPGAKFKLSGTSGCPSADSPSTGKEGEANFKQR